MLIVFIEFIIVALVVVVASKYLADNIETIEKHTTFNPIFMGLILSAATSLPELVSSLTSISLGNDVTAVSNVLGSNLFNIFALAIMNIFLFKKLIFRGVPDETFKTAKIAIIMYTLMVITYISTFYFDNLLLVPRLNIVITSLIIAIIYGFSIYSSGHDQDEVKNVDQKDVSNEVKNFILLVIVNIFASMILAHKAEAIVEVTGLSEGVVGSVLVGVATSLPEIITCYVLIQKGKFVMAVTSILGSNTFNFLTFVMLDFATRHSIYENLNSSILVFALSGLIMSIIMYNMSRVRGKLYLLPSFAIVILYLVAVSYTFTI